MPPDPDKHPTESVPQLVGELYRLVSEFERLFPGRRFTPDGHLVGSIGEVVAAYRYGLDLLPHSHQGHDARAPNGCLVEIKATQGSTVALRSEPQHLLVVHLGRQGDVSEIFNGPGRRRASCRAMGSGRSRSRNSRDSWRPWVRTSASLRADRGPTG